MFQMFAALWFIFSGKVGVGVPARTKVWAVFVRGNPFDARHVSVKPVVATVIAPVSAMAAMPG
jgi:hypothetical protein